MRILEARDRIGGRVWTFRDGAVRAVPRRDGRRVHRPRAQGDPHHSPESSISLSSACCGAALARPSSNAAGPRLCEADAAVATSSSERSNRRPRRSTRPSEDWRSTAAAAIGRRPSPMLLRRSRCRPRLHALADGAAGPVARRSRGDFRLWCRRAGARAAPMPVGSPCIASRAAPIDWSRPSHRTRGCRVDLQSRRPARVRRRDASITVTVEATTTTANRLDADYLVVTVPVSDLARLDVLAGASGLAAAWLRSASHTGRDQGRPAFSRRWWRQARAAASVWHQPPDRRGLGIRRGTTKCRAA